MARVAQPLMRKRVLLIPTIMRGTSGGPAWRRLAGGLFLGAIFCTASQNICLAQTFDQKIAAREAKLSPNDAVGRTNIAQLLYNHKEYRRALAEVNAALAINGQLQDAQLLRRLILRKLPAAGAAATVTQNAPAATNPGKKHKLLTLKQIYLVRLWELTRHETAPLQAVILDRAKTLNKFWHQDILLNPRYQNPPPTRVQYETFKSPTNLKRQIELMRRFGSPSIWSKIEIQSDPDDMRTFRTSVQPFVLQSCSTVGCHRGQDFPGFKLFGSAGAPNVRQTYTNFYILTHYTYKGRPLIDQNNPRMSLILQYVANPDVAAYRHPGKKGGPVTRRVNVTKIVHWIESLRYPQRNYGFTYELPKPSARP